MTALQWDASGSKFYESGIDRGILSIPDSDPVVWNGLVSIDDDATNTVTPQYLDGVKLFERVVPGDFSGKLKAYTYPTEFDQCLGTVTSGGLMVYNQRPSRFNLSYRTRIGNDIDGQEHGYRIHFLYNVLANPDSISFTSSSDQPALTEFGWDLSTVPTDIGAFRPTAHVSVSSLTTDPETFELLEAYLYGTDTMDPTFPTFEELMLFSDAGGSDILIIDLGDGRWGAVGSSDNITMTSPTQFQIANVDATMLDANTYDVSSTDNP